MDEGKKTRESWLPAEKELKRDQVSAHDLGNRQLFALTVSLIFIDLIDCPEAGVIWTCSGLRAKDCVRNDSNALMRSGGSDSSNKEISALMCASLCAASA